MGARTQAGFARRFFPGLVLLVVAGWLFWAWRIADLPRQQRLEQTFIATAVGYLLIFFWALLFRPGSWGGRLSAAAIIALPILAVAATTRIRGVNGDLLPIFEWRWAARRDAAIDPRQGIKEASEPTSAVALTNLSFSQFLGNKRDGRVDVNLSRDWAARPPRELWRQRIGPGWSGFAIEDSVAITQEQAGENEAVTAYDIETGKLRWRREYPARYATVIAGEGPRGTPAIESGRVYTFGSTGVLVCTDLASGELLWSHDVLKEHGGHVPDWGMASSPLLTEKHVVVNAGSSHCLAAYDRASGDFAWKAGDVRADYSSPSIAELAGQNFIVSFNGRSVTGHDVASGEQRWSRPWPSGKPHVTMPVPVGRNQLLVSSGYGVGSELFELKQNGSNDWTVLQVWKSIRLKSKFSNIIVRDGFAYGLDDGIMACIDLKDGSLKWKDGRYGHCQILEASDLFIFVTETGELKLVEPNPNALNEIASLKVFRDKTWNPIALAGPYLLARNDLEAACYFMPLSTINLARLANAARARTN